MSMSYYEYLHSNCPIRNSTSKLYSSLSVLFCFVRYIFLFPLLGDVIHAKYKKFYKFIFLPEYNNLYENPDYKNLLHFFYESVSNIS